MCNQQSSIVFLSVQLIDCNNHLHAAIPILYCFVSYKLLIDVFCNILIA